jgi:hypothetical protein
MGDRCSEREPNGSFLCLTVQFEYPHGSFEDDIGVLWCNSGEVAGECDASAAKAEVGNGAFPRRCPDGNRGRQDCLNSRKMASFLWWPAGIGCCRNRCRFGTLRFRGECAREGRDGNLLRERFERELGGDRETENDTKGALHRD